MGLREGWKRHPFLFFLNNEGDKKRKRYSVQPDPLHRLGTRPNFYNYVY